MFRKMYVDELSDTVTVRACIWCGYIYEDIRDLDTHTRTHTHTQTHTHTHTPTRTPAHTDPHTVIHLK